MPWQSKEAGNLLLDFSKVDCISSKFLQAEAAATAAALSDETMYASAACKSRLMSKIDVLAGQRVY